MGFFGKCRPITVDGVPCTTIGEASRKFRIPIHFIMNELEQSGGAFMYRGHRFAYADRDVLASGNSAKDAYNAFVPTDWGYEVNGMVYMDTIEEAAGFAFISSHRLRRALSKVKTVIIGGFRFSLVPRRKKMKVHDEAWAARQRKLLNGGVEVWEHRGRAVGGNTRQPRARA